jgi:hypothetical protein
LPKLNTTITEIILENWATPFAEDSDIPRWGVISKHGAEENIYP